MSLLVLSSSDVDKIASKLSPGSLQLLMAGVFARLSLATKGVSGTKKGLEEEEISISMPLRINVQMANHTTLFMPARIGPSPSYSNPLGSPNEVNIPSLGLGHTAIKVVSVPTREGDTHGLPATTLVLDEATGAVKAVVNARKLTTLRNAAGSLLSTTLIGPSFPRHIVAFGAGQQIESHLQLFLWHFYGEHRSPSSSNSSLVSSPGITITRCTIVNRTINERSSSLLSRLHSKFPSVDTHLLTSSSSAYNHNELESAVRTADIIICATSSTSPLFPSQWVRNGTHVILIGSYKPTMREVDRELVNRTIRRGDVGIQSGEERVVPRNEPVPMLLVDSRDACLHEAGELIDAKVSSEQLKEIGELVLERFPALLNLDQLVGNLTDDVPENAINAKKGRDSGFSGPVTIFKSVGIGLQDVAIANAVVDKAEEEGLGTVIHNYES